MVKEKVKKKSLWSRIFPGLGSAPASNNNALENQQYDLPPANVISDFYDGQLSDPAGNVFSIAAQGSYLIRQMPQSRLAKYPIFQVMASDPTIDSAIKMHISHALSAKSDNGEIISIESTSDKEDPITLDLRNTFKEIINENIQAWAYNAAVFGMWTVRLYGSSGKGIELVRSDYYTHPRHMKLYERVGQLVGYTSAYQQYYQGRVVLMEPWKFVAFRIPHWDVPLYQEPIRLSGVEFDISEDDFNAEEIIETQNYGTSLIETAFGPWMDLLDAILSLNMSRKNASKLERMIGVNTGTLSPQKAAHYLNTVASQILKTSQADANRDLRQGFIQTVYNYLLPIWGDGKGRLDISTVEGNPNIEAIADINFAVNRLGSALGVDPSLLGFGEQLSGGLGDGGFFRLSILAGIKSNMLRRAIATGLEEMFDIHVAYKFNKTFLPGEKPWRIVFNSLSSAIEREEAENRDGRVNYATAFANMVTVMDPQGMGMDAAAYKNFIWTDILKVDEEKFAAIYPKKLEGKAANPDPNQMPPEEGGDGGFGGDGSTKPPEPPLDSNESSSGTTKDADDKDEDAANNDIVTESTNTRTQVNMVEHASSSHDDHIREIVFSTLEEFYKGA
jgi:hypothetical protein